MRKTLLLPGIAGLAVALLLSLAMPTYAETAQFKADLTAASEVPPNQTTGTGTLTATYDSATKQLSWKGSFSGLSGPATAAHFHGPAEPGKNAGVVMWISTKGAPFASPFEGSATLTDAQASDLMDGRYYVNIHTAANPGGELRGQLNKM
jgi:hypothetical protein